MKRKLIALVVTIIAPVVALGLYIWIRAVVAISRWQMELERARIARAQGR
jgi:hypothetical protein